MTTTRSFELVGAPFDGAATLGWPGSRYAPARIRESLAWMTMRSQKGQVFSLDTGGLLPAGPDLISDAGDVAVVPHDVMATLDAAAEGVCRVIQRGNVPILLGGDDSLLLAGARGVHDAVDGSVAIVHFDAHLDLMDESVRQGRFSHSSGMRRALELDRVRIEHSIQLGPRHFNYPMSLEFIRASGLPQISSLQVIENGWRWCADQIFERISGADHVFFSFDIDTIDPAHAPGAGAHEPGGITSRDAIELVKVLAPHCDAFAVTEVNPMTDHNDLTSSLAAYLCYYFAVFGAVVA